MGLIFSIVAQALLWIAKATGLTYNEINVVLYYVIVPLTWAALLDQAFRFHWITLGCAVALATAVPTVALVYGLPQFCDLLFDASARFLRSFRFVGLNYVQASVVVCVVVPLIIYAALIWFAARSIR